MMRIRCEYDANPMQRLRKDNEHIMQILLKYYETIKQIRCKYDPNTMQRR